MQARLRSDRIHAAAQKALVTLQTKAGALKNAEQAKQAKEARELLRKKTWCGGYKYNEQTAKDRVKRYLWGYNFEYFGEEWYRIYKQIIRLESIVQKTNIASKPFPMLLEEKDYNLIWDEL